MHPSLTAPDLLVDLARRKPALEALRETPLDRRELERRLGISRATSHRLTNWLGDRGLLERVDGEFRLTEVGTAVADAVVAFEESVATALVLAPVVEATAAVEGLPPVPLAAFTDATVTDADGGDPHAPTVRFIALAEETETLRGFDTWSLVPTYMEEFQRRIVGGMETELVDPIAVVEDIMERYPERCVEVCASGNLTIRLHDELPFCLAVFDDRVGVRARDPTTGALGAFVDTDSPEARAWAEEVFAFYRERAPVLETFTRSGLRRAVAGG